MTCDCARRGLTIPCPGRCDYRVCTHVACYFCDKPDNHFFGIDEIHHSWMLEQLKILKNRFTIEGEKLTDIGKTIIVPNWARPTIEILGEQFKNLLGTGERYEHIKLDITPCSWHWPRKCEHMYGLDNAQFYHNTDKNICEILNKEKVDYVCVKRGKESIYAVAIIPMTTVIIYL